ncbi:hypothetical protein FRACYDRAFT_181000 [Fragilariopsis cylindrus CCMP1102]|uniref:DOT1 domain-containing protein n=1 Tax=Fragilariopsis cylindrus CCMP1102 TaxID=635003 RepID=A0A1E7FRT9_9STRA|nr:hypothetical protein FRACYDRAFT_181000 [Fragilariopsis cylindrus CCMP1102]|eukprot:OEU20837.1 hypothetical protein FRACYDRAFT_181000 [Fragilariopsis cylindrus CCMP1102]
MVSPAAARTTREVVPDDGNKERSRNNPCRVLFAGNDDGGTEDLGVAKIPPTSPLVTAATDKKRKYRSNIERPRVVTPSTTTTTTDDDDDDEIKNSIQALPSAKRRLLFGRYVDLVQCTPNVDTVYKIVRKLTGNIGGNGYSGPIYGELTKHSMQKVIDLMIKTTGFSSSSRFIDVGSGIGKPNLHVAQYPGVEFSCGIELEHCRWSLGMTCLNACLDAAVIEQEKDDGKKTKTSANNSLVQGNTMFLHSNILEAKTFDPFTHVYMFSIGFPPNLWIELSKKWNRSDKGSCQYLICYNGPKNIIDCYEFDVELIAQLSTSMHGSKEGHMGYIYRRTTSNGKKVKAKNGTSSNAVVACDPLFKPSYKLVKRGLKELQVEVARQVEEHMGGSGRTTRSRSKLSTMVFTR